ncbi:MAG: DUF523 domain-containing protein [Desulfosarcina sp.]|nr:DUF523 domain-containing protein [Desulfosarcina sp.]MBC2742588.1 DUF523 domain-containing protein [Desulfosarcina sp.]MBC2765498.1 DUF523 domain-containing protein [Desulfosarcina sp.]
MILVSACLCGQRCRYDGKTKQNQPLMARLGRENILAVCPEQLGGLPTPRPACRLVGGGGADVLAGRARVVDKLGIDRTGAFLRGARLTLEMALSNRVGRCCLKAKSPSCGSGRLMQEKNDGSLPSGYRPVLGVTAALLLAHGIDVEEIP